MLRLASDADVHGDILHGLHRRLPGARKRPITNIEERGKGGELGKDRLRKLAC